MKIIRSSILAIILLSILLSCEEVFFEKDQVNDPVNNFDYLWNNLNERYSLFDYKGIDWDSIYTIYRAKINENTPETELFNVMSEMLNTLKDGHLNLRSQFDISRYFPYSEANPNFSFDLVERNYLGSDYRFTGFLLNQILDENIGYIYYRSFQLPIKEWEIDTVINRFIENDVNGVIIDIRNNEGGNPENGLKLLGRLINQRTHIYTSQLKTGPGAEDFDQPLEIYLDPTENHPHFPGKVVVLTNRKVYSAGSYFSAGIFALPEVTLMGDTTGGGSGVPAGFDLPNGWYCNYSSSIGYLTNGVNFEGGVPPDMFIEMDSSDLSQGFDTIIETAISTILNN